MFLFTENSTWCWHPEDCNNDPGFMFFRNKFIVRDENCRLRLNVSADNRYNLYLDGKCIGRGPCRSDLEHYCYEKYDLPVSEGEHVLAVHIAVYNYGSRGNEGPVAEIHSCGGLLVAGGVFQNENSISDISTPGNWKCSRDKARTHRHVKEDWDVYYFTAIPDMEKIDFHYATEQWKLPCFDDGNWYSTVNTGSAIFVDDMSDQSTRWWLMPREIPMLKEEPEKFFSYIHRIDIDRTEQQLKLPDNRSAYTAEPIVIPENSRISIILDAGTLTTAFPHITVSGSEKADILLKYSETLIVDGERKERDHRDGVVEGCSDRLLCSEGELSFTPFWFRTFRFLQIDVDTSNSGAVTINSVAYSTFRYPFELKAEFNTGNESITRIWDIAWRTARLCAHEHYEDCPYYEQLQYAGDTRIQALISYALTGDGRLGKQAILQFDWSRFSEGLTQSRYPSYWLQVIPGFSLFWILMVKDHYDYFGDKKLVMQVLPGISAVLEWFERNRNDNGLIGHLNYWNFTDWVDEWKNGSPGRGEKVPLTINSLIYTEACNVATELCEATGVNTGNDFEIRAESTLQAIDKFCFDSALDCYVDIPGTEFISKHTNAWAIISGAAGDRAQLLGKRIFEDPEMSRTTLYFTFYLFQAWRKTGQNAYFWKELQQWKDVQKWNFTTFPESPRPDTRSDCHAWSASPLYEFVTSVMGIQPAAPGFSEILIKPNPGLLKNFQGHAPCADTTVHIEWKTMQDGEINLKILLDNPKPAKLILPDGKQYTLKETDNIFKFKPVL